MKLRQIVAAVFAVLAFFAGMPEKASSQMLLQKQDSIVAFVNSVQVGGDSIAVITLGGSYSSGAFTVTGVTDSSEIVPEARYSGSSNWVKISVRNNKTMANDTLINVTDGANPLDYTINDPCLIGFRLRKTSTDRLAVISVFYRFRKDY
jgi:hypothetical protein